ncbi:hypothetical protein [Neobacillus niacini]|uniref:hypothetical protein n=1 Tax=Neobacillus niacini TaxID=86668 RepID=UPI00203AB29C|nr:hypothetical protein [Neobacillus niacini]MCM3690953.1 hypothetical protein [Neobacillus niacini]
MNQESSSNLVNHWNHAVSGYRLTLKSYLEALKTKQRDCENELHQLVTNTKISERKDRMLVLIEEQDKISQLIDDVERILDEGVAS